jgi:hypothetical protein
VRFINKAQVTKNYVLTQAKLWGSKAEGMAQSAWRMAHGA